MRLLLLGCTLVFFGCQSPQARFEEETTRQTEAWKLAIKNQAAPEKSAISWDAALSSLQANNIELLRAKAAIEDARSSVRQVKYTLLPTIYLQSSNNTQLNELDQLDLDEFSFRLYGFLNISGLLKFQPRLFAARLGTIYASITYQLREREQIIELYRLFMDAEETNQKLAQLESALRFVDQNQEGFSLQRLELVKQQAQLESARTTQANNLSQLIGDHTKYWIPKVDTLPSLEYNIPETYTDFAAEHFGQLETKLYALEIIKAQADLKRIRFRRWPDFNLALSGPPLVESSSGETTYWSADDVRLNAWAFWNFDTQGFYRNQTRTRKRVNAIEMHEIQQTRAQSARKLLNLLEQLRKLQDQEELLEEKLGDTNLAPAIQESLEKVKIDLKKQTLEYELLLLFFDNHFKEKIQTEVK